MTLTDLACRQANPQSRAYKLTDSGGLYLDVVPTGRKTWRLKYRFYAKEKLLTIGPYPTISLVVAREKRDLAKQMLRDGVDPGHKKQEDKKLARYKESQTFELVALEWHEHMRSTWSKNYADELLRRLNRELFPFIGNLPVSKLSVQHLLNCLQKIEKRERNDLAHRILQVLGQVVRYAVITGRMERDITQELRGALKKYTKGHFAAIDADELPNLLKALEKNEARLFRQTILAIKLILLTFVRTSVDSGDIDPQSGDVDPTPFQDAFRAIAMAWCLDKVI